MTFNVPKHNFSIDIHIENTLELRPYVPRADMLLLGLLVLLDTIWAYPLPRVGVSPKLKDFALLSFLRINFTVNRDPKARRSLKS